MRRNWTTRFTDWLRFQFGGNVPAARRCRRGRRSPQRRESAEIRLLESLESRRLLTNVVAVTVSSDKVVLDDVSGPRVGSGDTFDVSYTSTQMVLTGHSGTVFRVNGTDQSTYTVTLSSPVALKMLLNSHGNTVNVTGDGTANLKAFDVNLGGGKSQNTLTLTKVIADSVSIDGSSRGGNSVTITNSTVNHDLDVSLRQKSSDVLDLETVTLKGDVVDTTGQMIVNHTTIAGTLKNSQSGKDAKFTSTASTYTGAVTMRLGPDAVVIMASSTDGANHFKSSETLVGPRGHKPTVYQTSTSAIYDVTPKLKNVNASTKVVTMATPTVTAQSAPTATPTIKGTYDATNSSKLSVTANNKTYTLGVDSQLTAPTTGNWSLDLTGSPLPLATNTVTATTTDANGNTKTGTGTVTNEQVIISNYLSANSLTATKTASGLNYVVSTTGIGAIPTSGQTVTVNYTGHILNADGTQGAEFDSNIDSQFNHVTPFSFTLGAGSVIAGWDEAFKLLPTGSVVKLIIPSKLAYGTTGTSGTVPIPANSILIFDVTIGAVSITAPTVNSQSSPTSTPVITGTYDAINSPTLKVAVGGTTYTLGTDAALTSPSAGTWSLNLASAPLTAQTNTVTATSFDKVGKSASGTGTITNEQAIISNYLGLNSLTATKTASGLNYVVMTPGSGATPTTGQSVTVNYTGHLLKSDGTEGAEFDSNVDPQFNHVSPFTFTLGAGSVIAGWDEAFKLLPVGTVARLLIPSKLAYGTAGNSGGSVAIPANSILIFDVTVVSAT